MDKRKHLFWTPCAAHCLDLMLEDVGKIPKVKQTIEKGFFLVGYIYNHCGVLNMMREFTKNKELTRSVVTRFATTYLTLQSLHKQKLALRTMFTSDKWKESKRAKQPTEGGLRMLFKHMQRAKITIAKALGENSVDYQVVSAIIDKRWDCQLPHPLHAAGYYFNPEFYCYRPEIEKDQEVTDGMIKCVQRLVPSKDKQDLIMKEMVKWVNQEGRFALDIAKRAHCTIAPDKLTYFEFFILFFRSIPRKGNRLEHKKLQDLVFVKYNKTLKNLRDKEVVYDLISLDNIDDCNEWMTRRMEEERVFEDEDLTWEVVGEASGAGETRATRSSQPSSSRALVDEDSEKDDLDESKAEYPIDVDGSSDDQFDDGLDD
ncbi:uncharacterized protein LOC110883082 [Helianthus annuus]|uniref:uncharacterized protein LOC110883082 n=1 Tax=Helianthus annuus TaxID=4232 RepID=UPI000B901629|nr:uncharacterized protein LOC110883082 [Helianthus annuus]